MFNFSLFFLFQLFEFQFTDGFDCLITSVWSFFLWRYRIDISSLALASDLFSNIKLSNLYSRRFRGTCSLGPEQQTFLFTNKIFFESQMSVDLCSRYMGWFERLLMQIC